VEFEHGRVSLSIRSKGSLASSKFWKPGSSITQRTKNSLNIRLNSPQIDLNSCLKLMAERENVNETRVALMEAAAALFAEKGFEVVSVREITTLARANVASVKYHFGSREGLIDSVVARMAKPVNDERLRRIKELEGLGVVTVTELITAFFEPLFSEIQNSPLSEKLFTKLMGRVVGDRSYELPEEVMGQFREVASRYVPAFMGACPGLSADDVFWRIHFCFGVLANTLTHRDILKKISDGKIGDEKLSVTLKRIIDFCDAGFRQ
jgi:AcrR family transcriptional regulator